MTDEQKRQIYLLVGLVVALGVILFFQVDRLRRAGEEQHIPTREEQLQVLRQARLPLQLGPKRNDVVAVTDMEIFDPRMSIVAVDEIGDASKRHLAWLDPNIPVTHLVALDFLPPRIVDATEPLYEGLSARSGAIEWQEDDKTIRGIPDGFGGYFDISDSDLPVHMYYRYRPTRSWIPALDFPKSVTPEAALAQKVYGATWEAYLNDEDRVLGLEIGGEARAYPVKILRYHQIINDRIGDEPVAIIYSPLSGSGLAYRAEVNGATTTFGDSGLLLDSTMLAYDQGTKSLWEHYDGAAVAGPMKDATLEILPLIQTTWETWLDLHPETLVLSAATGYRNVFPYGADPYHPNFQSNYYTDERLLAPVEVPGGSYEILLANIDDRLSNKAWVIGLRGEESQEAYPVSELAISGEEPFSATFEGRKILIQYNPEVETGYAVDTKGNPLPEATLTLWFAWKAFYPATGVYFSGEPGSM